MTLTQTLPIVAALLFLICAVTIIHKSKSPTPTYWVIPAAFCAAFTAWSLAAVVTEGPFGFWPEHVRNMWGNQIWFDLLLAIGLAFLLIAPRARKLGMKLSLWLIFILCTGSIGLSAMVARYLYLDSKTTDI